MTTKDLICEKCKHHKPITGGCNAFKDGIPDIILLKNIHDKPLPEQNNDLVFEEGQSEEDKIFN